MKNNIHVLYKNNEWYIKIENKENIIKTFNTKDEAITYAKALAQKEKVELVIHNKNNIISNKNSYGNDTNPPKDQKL